MGLKMAATSDISGFRMYYIALLAIFCSLAAIQTAKLNVPKVLLPYYSTVVTNYSLEVTETVGPDTCYIWKTSRPEVVTIQVINSTDGECSQHALVSAISKSSHRMTAIMSAENKVTGEVLRCYVIVDAIAKIQIETTTRELFLEDTPEDFYVMGFDNKGNVFDSLEGLVFEWALLSDTDMGDETIVDAHNVLRIVNFGESNYQTPAHIELLEARGLQGDTILVDGIRTGTARVRATIKDPAYKHVVTEAVQLVVRANLLISPPDAYVLKFSNVKYKVEMVKKNTIVGIPMPSPQYYLHVQEDEICSLNVRTSTATGKELGSTVIVLRDRNINVEEPFSQPSAMLHVVHPSYLAFVVLPTRKWVLETGREYDILMEVYDKDSHKLYSADNFVIRPVFHDVYLDVKFSTHNGTFHHVKALKRGMTRVDGTLATITLENGTDYFVTPTLRHSQEVEIYDPITVTPPVLFFSWDLEHTSYQYQLKANGGSGEYVWNSNKTSVSTVTIRGEITTGGLGSTTVTAADVKNQAHYGSMQVHVLPPHSITFLPSRVEAEIGTVLELPLAIYSTHIGEKVAVTDCHLLSFNISFSDSSVFAEESVGPPSKEGSCATLKVLGSQQGNTEVTLEYTGSAKLQTSVTIAAYKPLLPIDPEDIAVVAVGSSKEVIFEGGPLPWVLDPSKYFQELSVEVKSVVSHEPVNMFGLQKTAGPEITEELGSFHIFHVLCKDLGEQGLTLNVGNQNTLKNEYPATSRAKIQFACVPPVSLQLSPLIRQLVDLPPCPISQDPNQPIPIHCEKGADLLISVFDGKGRKFDNFSSLAVDWEVSNTALAQIDTPPDVYVDSTTLESGARKIKSYQKLDVFGKTGRVLVTASISRYDSQTYFIPQGIRFDYTVKPRISKSVELVLVEEPSITPNTISVFNHPSNKVSLEVQKGSGYFHVEEGTSDTAEVQYLQRKRKIEVVPSTDGVLVVRAYDLCLELELEQHPKATVYVSGVGSIELTIVDKIEVTNEVTAKVEVLDTKGAPLSASFFPLMKLTPSPASDIIAIRDETVKSTEKFSAYYVVYGSTVGHTSLSYQAQLKSGQIIISHPKQIEVFPPLRLSPRNITLICGAEFQVLASGGPNPSSSIEFYVLNRDTSRVSGSGLLRALQQGATRVVGKAVGHDPTTGEHIVYSQDQVDVYVVKLTGIKIHSPLTRMQKHSQMPLYAVGVTEHETPFTFGSSVPPLLFTWSVTNQDVVQLKSAYHESGINLPDENNFASQLVATAPGHVTVKLQVKSSGNSACQMTSNAALQDEIQIRVFDRLSFVNPNICDGQLLITPDTETRVKTNRDGASRLIYQITHQNPDNLGLRVDSAGHLVSYSTTGQATLLVMALEDFGLNQTSTLLIKVERVAYVMLNADTVFNTSNGRLSNIPVGATMQFTVSYHDHVGAVFHATNNRINYRSNRFDHLQVTSGLGNNTLLARATDVGHTIIKVWSQSDMRMVDYLNVPVDYAISPSVVSLTLGDLVCFTSPLVSEGGRPGTWSVSGKSVVTNGKSGIAVATGIGSSTVRYSVSEGVVTHTEATVLTVNKIFVSSSYTFITNYRSGVKKYQVNVALGKDRNVIGENCEKRLGQEPYPVVPAPFHCLLEMSTVLPELTIADLFQARALFDPSTGRYSCDILRSLNEYLTQQISTIDTDITLRVRIPSRSPQPEVTSPELRFEFYPAFYVHNAEVHISNLSPMSSLRVSLASKLVDQMRIVSSDSDIVELLPAERDSKSGSVLLFPIRLLETATVWEKEKLDVTVDVICQSTGQKERVAVIIKLLGQKPEYVRSREAGWLTILHIIASSYQSWIILLLASCATLAVIVIAYYAMFGPRYSATSAPGIFSRPGSPVPQSSPYRISPTAIAPYYNPDGSGYSAPGSPYSAAGTPYRLWSTGYRPQETSPTRSRFRKSPHSPPGGL